jgi:hypothetical protein
MTRPQIEAALKSVRHDVSELEDEMKNIINDPELSPSDTRLMMQTNTICMTLGILRVQELEAILEVTE